MGPVRSALSDSGLQIGQIDKVLMVGGSSRIPAVQEAVQKLIGKEPFKGINPDECVVPSALPFRQVFSAARSTVCCSST